MTQFIIWPKTIDAEFRAAYLAETGEKIQDNPMESEDELFWMIGSNRVTQAQMDNLKITHAELVTNADVEPTGWVPKIYDPGL